MVSDVLLTESAVKRLVEPEEVASLVHAHGYRWNRDGVWTRLAVGDTDPETGRAYTGPPETARLRRGERIVVDEAGMLDQDSALARQRALRRQD